MYIQDRVNLSSNISNGTKNKYWIGAAVGAAGSIVSGLIGNHAAGNSVTATKLNNANNLQLAREQREFDYKMVQEQNQYNSPEEQRKRLEEAGYNPLMMADAGVVNSGSQNSSAGGQTAPMMESGAEAYRYQGEAMSNAVNGVFDNFWKGSLNAKELKLQEEKIHAAQIQNRLGVIQEQGNQINLELTKYAKDVLLQKRDAQGTPTTDGTGFNLIDTEGQLKYVVASTELVNAPKQSEADTMSKQATADADVYRTRMQKGEYILNRFAQNVDKMDENTLVHLEHELKSAGFDKSEVEILIKSAVSSRMVTMTNFNLACKSAIASIDMSHANASHVRETTRGLRFRNDKDKSIYTAIMDGKLDDVILQYNPNADKKTIKSTRHFIANNMLDVKQDLNPDYYFHDYSGYQKTIGTASGIGRTIGAVMENILPIMKVMKSPK